MLMYYFILPKLAIKDINKIAMNDALASVVALIISASLFMGKELTFNFMSLQLSWFSFTLLSYFVIETPFMLRYMHKNNVLNKND